MNREREQMIDWLRGELVGPNRPVEGLDPEEARFDQQGILEDRRVETRGALLWHPDGDAGDSQEILYYDRESPVRKYGAGLLHPEGAARETPEDAALAAGDTLGVELSDEERREEEDERQNLRNDVLVDDPGSSSDEGDDFEVHGRDLRRPSTMGISFCVRFDEDGKLLLKLPRSRRFEWQSEGSAPFMLNGRYESAGYHYRDADGNMQERHAPCWCRRHALEKDVCIGIDRTDLQPNRVVRKTVDVPDDSPLVLEMRIYPRRMAGDRDDWLITAVLCNTSPGMNQDSTLFQAFFEVAVDGGELRPYPESGRPFDQLDADEQSLQLLYRESRIWGIGHGCAAGWEADPGQVPETVFADVMPAVQLPSMTPDIHDRNGNPVHLSMRSMYEWNEATRNSLQLLVDEYNAWVEAQEAAVEGLPEHLQEVASRHMEACRDSLQRMRRGMELLENDQTILSAFRLANLAMLLQQIAGKQLEHRGLEWSGGQHGYASPSGECRSPWQIFENNEERGVGQWRAFQLAFLLMSIEGVVDGATADRELVDLIWFPTGGGKTEAYLGVMALVMFHLRLECGDDEDAAAAVSGTNVLMRYTLRMLTTQQFQRAASLICAMEYLRNHPPEAFGPIRGGRFSLGLWIGRDGSPNKAKTANEGVRAWNNGKREGNPLVLTECPWCRAEIGRFDGNNPNGIQNKDWEKHPGRIAGVRPGHGNTAPVLICPDKNCEFGGEWGGLPVEVIDTRIYENPPSIVISTVDKLAMLAWRPEAGALFGRQNRQQERRPPALIVQDELHLISGPLGTMYALYEGIFEKLCTEEREGRSIPPKIIASTATIRSANEQVRALYARNKTRLFPSPGLTMGDSFFGRYATGENGALSEGRLYLGVHADNLPSMMTAQVRTFSSALFRAGMLPEESDTRDPWWTLLAFYNSLRELGGARTLFDSDICSRLYFLFSREGVDKDGRRYLNRVSELTSRLQQTEVISMMDQLMRSWNPDGNNGEVIDACLASNIIEVGVDIDRLSLMAVVGQPKTTSQYIQVTGRVGRRWWERPGLILSLYNPFRSRDRSHFEQFHGYHRRLYEQVEPTSATPFSPSAIERGGAGVLIAWARQNCNETVGAFAAWEQWVDQGLEHLIERCRLIEGEQHGNEAVEELQRVAGELKSKWQGNPQEWENYPPGPDDEYLMLWPGQYYRRAQRIMGVEVPSSMRQVDSSARLEISEAYLGDNNNG